MASITSPDISDIDLDMNCKTSVSQQMHSFVLVWLCPVDSFTTLLVDRFKNIATIKSVETFDVPFVCISHLSKLQGEKVILILSCTLAKNVVSIVHDMTNVFHIYLFSNKLEIDSQWIHEYTKIHGLYSDIDTLTSKILADTKEITIKTDKSTYFDDEESPIFIYNDSQPGYLAENSNKTAGDFISFQIFIEVILASSELTNKYAIEKATQMCREIYKDNGAQLVKIDSFERTYTSEDAIKWYTKDCFLSRILNKAFHRYDLEVLFTFRFFIHDLYTQLNQLYIAQKEILQQRITLFAGMLLPVNEVQHLQANIGGLISTKGFFETSTDSIVAFMFSGEGNGRPEFQSVVFEMNIDSNMNYVKPFAHVAHLSHFPDERTVIISPGFVFRIESLEDFGNIWHVKLTSTNTVQNGVDELINQFKMELDTSVDYISFGKVLNKLNKMNETEKYYDVLLKMLLPSQKDMAKIFHNLGNACFLQNKDQMALEYYKKALTNCDYLNAELMSAIHCDIGRFYQSKTEYERALDYFKKSMDIASHTGSQSSNLVAIYNGIGDIYLHQNKYDLALDNFKLALNIALQMLPSEHPFIGQCLHNIGSTHLHKENYDLAIFHFNLALEKALRVLPSEHPFIRQCLNDITSLTKRISEVDHVASATERLQISSTTNERYDFTSSTKEFQSLSTSDNEYNDPSS